MANINAFDKAVEHAMLYEVGSFWKLTPEVSEGLIGTKEQRRACGYTNDPVDRGGETKFGIAKSGNPDLDITSLTWDAAKRIYYKRYWIQSDCQDLPPRLAVLHFDGAVNHGVGREIKFLQKALGAIPDGDIGPATLRLVREQDDAVVCNAICNLREQYYKDIVANNPSQSKYINGWLRRIQEMREFVTNPDNDFQ